MIKRMCMVDDDPDDRELFKQAMKSVNPEIELSFAFDGNEALKHMLTNRPDVIFLDCIMPGMDGIECLTKLKANRITRQIPVIIYTGSANISENELAIRLGAFQLLQKTTHLNQLCNSITQLITILNKPYF
jgi:CheY-like chemotaxis protein